MKCLKCNGWMCTERLSDFHAMFDIWRCVNCGARLDKTILENQRAYAHVSSGADDYQADDYQSDDLSW